MSGKKKVDHYAPRFSGPHFRWYMPLGMLALMVQVAFRYFISGRELRGAGDNATWFHDATVDYRGRPVEKLTKARWQRVARRWVLIGIPLLLLGFRQRGALLGYLGVLTLALVFLGCRKWRGWYPYREVRREFVYPVWEVCAKAINVKMDKGAAIKAVQLPPGFGIEEEESEEYTGDVEELTIRINLPVVPLDDNVKAKLVSSAAQRLGISNPSSSWFVKGAVAYVDITPASFPPRKLQFSEVRDEFFKASATRPFVGLAAKRKSVFADLDNDGPHIGISGGTGTGKSTLARIILSKRVRDGAGLIVCDYKVTSHPWAKRIAQEDPSRVMYLMDEEPISDAILAVYAEFERRREILKTDPAALDSFRDIDLLVEELNSLASKLRAWWGHERRRILVDAKDEGESVPYVPVVPPAVDALASLVQMGRELKIRVHFAAQRLDAGALSPKDGGAIRESITNRFLAKYTKQTWNMLCSGVPFEAFPGGPRGIWTAVVSGEVTHFRVPPMSNEDAYLMAMGGQAPAQPILGGARLEQTFRRAIDRTVTLGEAWELIPGCPSLDALRAKVKREQPKIIGRSGHSYTYDMADLLALYGSTPERVLEAS
jgi:hypothetical protein